jgi:hypothetical protein
MPSQPHPGRTHRRGPITPHRQRMITRSAARELRQQHRLTRTRPRRHMIKSGDALDHSASERPQGSAQPWSNSNAKHPEGAHRDAGNCSVSSNGGT